MSKVHLTPTSLLFTLAFILPGLAAPVPQVVSQTQSPSDPPQNVILFISDGLGPAGVTMARDYVRDVLGGSGLVLDGILTGSVRTFATDSRITDSAAGATAYSAGVKTYNGAISVDTLRRPLGTILEAAEDEGLATGLVATSRITHATPAAFASHVPDRNMENEIAAQMMERGVDVILGGGKEFFVTEGGKREDGRDLIQEARTKGYHVIESRSELGDVHTPVLGLFASGHMAFEIDRDSTDQPSLVEMTQKAIELLEDDPDGFFLMVEGSRIDHAAHENDAAAQLHDILAYDQAIAAALDYARRHGNTLVVSVSDHETGGLSVGRDGKYFWDPVMLSRVQTSREVIVGAFQKQAAAPGEIMSRYAGIAELTAAEDSLLRNAGVDAGLLHDAVEHIISTRAALGWTTGGHTAVDVNLYAFGPGSEKLAGHHDNTHVGKVIAELLNLDLEAVTVKLRQLTALD